MGLGSGIREPESEIRDPEKTFSGSRIRGSKRHQIPDPDPQHCFQDANKKKISLKLHRELLVHSHQSFKDNTSLRCHKKTV
jgi:hypothetical protein